MTSEQRQSLLSSVTAVLTDACRLCDVTHWVNQSCCSSAIIGLRRCSRTLRCFLRATNDSCHGTGARTTLAHTITQSTAPFYIATTLPLWFTYYQPEMWANAQRDGRPAEYRWRPLLNATKFGWRLLIKCRAVTLPRHLNRNSETENPFRNVVNSHSALRAAGKIWMNDNQRRQRLLNTGGTSCPKGKYVNDTHRALIRTCRHSLKVPGGWRHSSYKIDCHSLFDCLGVLLVPQTLVAPFCRQFDNNFDKLWGYKTFRPRLTKYCRGCVPGIPGGVDAYVGQSMVSRFTIGRTIRESEWVSSFLTAHQHIIGHSVP